MAPKSTQVRTRMLGVVGAEGEKKPSATQLAAYLNIPKVHSLRNKNCFTIDFAIYPQAPCLFEIEPCGLGIEELSIPLFLKNYLFPRPLILEILQ